MKNYKLSILFLMLIITSSISSPMKLINIKSTASINTESVVKKSAPMIQHTVTCTVYNPVSSQCDEDPLITADNSKIDLERLKRGELRWIAVSRDLRKYYKYGTKVYLEGDPEIEGIYLVKDTMHPRWKNRIDILTYDRKLGKWENIRIRKI